MSRLQSRCEARRGALQQRRQARSRARTNDSATRISSATRALPDSLCSSQRPLLSLSLCVESASSSARVSSAAAIRPIVCLVVPLALACVRGAERVA